MKMKLWHVYTRHPIGLQFHTALCFKYYVKKDFAVLSFS